MADESHPIEHPTYLTNVRFMFEPRDAACMRRRDIDLRTYQGVKINAQRIYFHVREGSMPPPKQNRRSSAEKFETFYNWMRDGTPRGVAPVADMREVEALSGRVRRDISILDPEGEEIAKLKRAFEGLMARDPEDPNSYFALAGLHWLPKPGVWWRHHENAYNPWHRAFLMRLEDALRSVGPRWEPRMRAGMRRSHP